MEVPAATPMPRASTTSGRATSACERAVTSLFLEPQRFDDAGDAFGVFREELAELVPAEENRRPAELVERCFPGRGLGCALHELDERIALLRRDSRRAEYAAPVPQLDVDALLLQRRNVVGLRGRRLGKRAPLPGLALFRKFADARDPRRHVPAEDRDTGFAAALERHVVDLGRIDADRPRNQADQDVVGAA